MDYTLEEHLEEYISGKYEEFKELIEETDNKEAWEEGLRDGNFANWLFRKYINPAAEEQTLDHWKKYIGEEVEVESVSSWFACESFTGIIMDVDTDEGRLRVQDQDGNIGLCEPEECRVLPRFA